MTTVLLFAEHELDQDELTATLDALASLHPDGNGRADVSVLVPYAAHRSADLMLGVAAARGMSASRATADSRHEAAARRASADRVLVHVLSAVRGAGYVARGELVGVHDVVRDLVAEAASRGATKALVVTSPHRFVHLVHRDLEHRLLRAGLSQVVRVHSPQAAVAPSGEGS
jgi:hypothetical protein